MGSAPHERAWRQCCSLRSRRQRSNSVGLCDHENIDQILLLFWWSQTRLRSWHIIEKIKSKSPPTDQRSYLLDPEVPLEMVAPPMIRGIAGLGFRWMWISREVENGKSRLELHDRRQVASQPIVPNSFMHSIKGYYYRTPRMSWRWRSSSNRGTECTKSQAAVKWMEQQPWLEDNTREIYLQGWSLRIVVYLVCLFTLYLIVSSLLRSIPSVLVFDHGTWYTTNNKGAWLESRGHRSFHVVACDLNQISLPLRTPSYHLII